MPTRLVYSPKAYVYTKDASGKIYNVSNYVTSGEVNRLINQVSTASVTLRNPNKIFTKPGSGQVFHPQDPIVIFLQRLAGHPVRVFTGYLNETVYYQMYPGTITLKASCTLKKLLYTFFDPSLPYLINFFKKYGWINSGSGSILSPYSVGAGATNSNLSKTILNDASISRLLYATITDIGDWHETKVYIEPLPNGQNGVASLMASLMRSFEKESAVTQQEYTAFMNQVIGTGSQGTGGGNSVTATSTGEIHDIAKIVATVKRTADAANIPPELVLTVMDIESTYGQNMHSPGNPHYGYYQMQIANPPYAGMTTTPTLADTYDLGISTGIFVNAAVYRANQDNNLRNNLQQWAMITQGVTLQNNPLYGTEWDSALAQAKANLSQYGNTQSTGTVTKSTKGHTQASVHVGTVQSNSSLAANLDVSSPSTQLSADTNQRGSTDKSTSKSPKGSIDTRIDNVIKAANAINAQKYPYAWGGGHPTIGVPSQGTTSSTGGATVTGFDCSGSVCAVLYAAGLLPPGGAYKSDAIQNALGALALSSLDTSIPSVNIYANPDHVFMQIDGRFWGTSDPGSTGGLPTNGGGAGWLPDTTNITGFTEYHIDPQALKEQSKYQLSLSGGSTTVPGGAGTASDSSNSITSTAVAAAFVSQIEVPTLEDSVEAIMLGKQHRGIMHDQNLLPFVQQLAQSSLRSFMSLPNGDFYAFYPDYFGEMGHHQPYWMIDDIELLKGDINLTDENLATHVFAVGDTTWPANNQMVNDIFSAGTVTIFNAFVSGTTQGLIDNTKPGGDNTFLNLLEKGEAVDFIKRYGARPSKTDFPMIRSPLFEMLMAYQLFCLAWSRQFTSNFEFTFMPELFPGGKVGFPSHGVQMYIDEVTHSFDYESGFTTVATLTAPAVMSGYTNPDLPPNMVAALVEPVRSSPTPTVSASKKNTNTAHPAFGNGLHNAMSKNS